MEASLTDTPTPSHGPYTARILPPEEWDAKFASYELAHYVGLPDPDSVILVVVEDSEGRIVASWYAMNLVHCEGVYIDEAHRGNPTIAKLLTGALLGECDRRGIPNVLTRALTPSILSLARKLGFEVLPGTLLQRALPRE